MSPRPALGGSGDAHTVTVTCILHASIRPLLPISAAVVRRVFMPPAMPQLIWVARTLLFYLGNLQGVCLFHFVSISIGDPFGLQLRICVTQLMHAQLTIFVAFTSDILGPSSDILVQAAAALVQIIIIVFFRK
jgi:hypothetical protein